MFASWKIRPPQWLSRVHVPVLTAAEKSALGILLSLILSGAALRAWERSGVALGPVEDWEGLRRLVIRAPRPSGDFPCAESSPVFSQAGFAGSSPKTRSAKSHGSSGKKTGPARPLDLNKATESQLLSLPGVGPSTAKAILAWRAGQGPFTAPEDLLKVKGIGPKKFEALRRFVLVPGMIPGAAPGSSSEKPP